MKIQNRFIVHCKTEEQAKKPDENKEVEAEESEN